MKKLILIMMLLTGYIANAQTTGVGLSENGKEGEYGEWQKVDDKLPDGKAVTYEYRLRLRKKLAFACHYDVEIKNTSSEKFMAVVSFSYFDRLVNQTYSGVEKVKVKPGGSGEIGMLVQGCKKKKDEPKDMSDYDICRSCGLQYTIKLIQ